MHVITPFDPWNSPLCTCPKKYSFSPYTGCGHGCLYCYITAYVPHAFNPREKKILLNRLRRDVRTIDLKKHISMANSSDPYSPPEESLGLTRQALKVLLDAGFRVLLITKSILVVRDLDIIRCGNCSVSMTITTLNDEIAQRLEPGAPLPRDRLRAVRKLVEEGVPCSVRIDPIIPGVNNEKLEIIVKTIAKAGVSHIVASTYKAKRDNFDRVITAFPKLGVRLKELYWEEGERKGRCQYLKRGLREELLVELKEVVEENGITYATCREGMPKLHSGKTCDGSHLIPTRRGVSKMISFTDMGTSYH